MGFKTPKVGICAAEMKAEPWRCTLRASRQTSDKVTTMSHLDKSGRIDEIFIVHDDYDMREALSAIFRNEGYRTAAFADGRSFLRLARDQAPACVLLDLCMPGTSGQDVLKELDARNYSAPILIISAQEDVLNVVQAMRNGAFDYLEKRLDAEAIVTRAGLTGDPGLLPAYTPRTRGVDADRRCIFQQGNRAKSRHQPTDRGNPPRPHHAQARRQKFRRSHAYRHEQRDPTPGCRGTPKRVGAGCGA
jgi:CheY-like chemotaxis protein